MRQIFTLTLAAFGLFSFSNVHAQSANHAPICVSKSIVVGLPVQGADMVSLNINPMKFDACTDQDGDDLQLVSVSSPATMSSNNEAVIPFPDSVPSIEITYSVSDGKGGTATSTITLTQQ